MYSKPPASGVFAFREDTMNRTGIIFIVLAVIFSGTGLLASCGGGGSSAKKVAVVGDYNGSYLASFLTGEGLDVDNYPLNQDSEQPAVWGSIVAWEDVRNGMDDGDVYAYNIATDTEFKVNQDTGTTQSYDPRVYGDYIIWRDRRHGSVDIYAYKISTGTEFIVNQDTPGTSGKSFIVISNNVVAWTDQRSGDDDIYARNIDSMAAEFRVDQDAGNSAQFDIAMHGDIVTWRDYRNGNPDIYARNISTMDPEFRVDQDPGTNDQVSQAVYGDFVVWQDARPGNTQPDIYARNISTMASSEFRVNTDATSTSQNNPEIYGDYVVWVDARNGNSDIYARNITTMATEFRVNQDAGTALQNRPAIYGDYIVWRDRRNGDSDIYAYQISTATEFKVNQDSSSEDQDYPAIHEDHIVWEDERNIHSDIYVYSVATSTETFLNPGKVDVAALPMTVSDYSVLLFGNDFWGSAGGSLALQVFDAADAANVNMLGIGTDEEYPLGYLLAENGRFGLSSDVEYDGTIIEVDVTPAGQGHPIFSGMDTSSALTLEVGGASHQQGTYSTNPLDPDSPADWTILAQYSPSMILSGQCAIAEFTTPNDTKVLLDGSSTIYNDYTYWTQTGWDLLYNEIKYLMNN